MLKITNLSAQVENKEILHSISFDFQSGKNYCILGKNGSGKSSLAMLITGNPKYEITGGTIELDGQVLNEMSPDERARAGIFLTFQNIPEIPGVKLFEFLKSIYDAKAETPSTFLSFKKIIEPLMQELEIPKDFLWRDLNVGFSGGEKRKIEVLQIKLLNPKYIILDEIDSGLDVNAVRQVAELLETTNTPDNIFIIITHLFEMLQNLPLEQVLVLEKGVIKQVGGRELIEKVKKDGF
ncbi:MAG: Fe-S cluster assembly ATPase SufC [candidate division SR1 bacterium]|nr:Fe-S cluster assembly ATPase SufC [candidate division SR1 bacterium]